MFGSAVLHHPIVWAFMALLAWAAWSDFQIYQIPNRICLAIAALYPAYALTAGLPAITILWALAIALAAFVAGAGLFAARIMGGGDVKLIAASALWAGPTLILPFLLATGLAGGVLASVLWIAERRRGRPEPVGAAAPATDLLPATGTIPLPYGVAIAAGGLYTALTILSGQYG